MNKVMIITDYNTVLAYLRAGALNEPDFASFLPSLREAKIFARILEKLPIGKIDGELLGGDYGMIFADAGLKEQLAAWQPVNCESKVDHDEPLIQLSERFGCRAGFSPAHSSAFYDMVLRQGLIGMMAELKASVPEDPEYLQAELIALQAVIDWSNRYAALGFEACSRVPAEPARDFAEAVQSVWLVHTAIGIGERCDASLSLGRLDQYLYPYFCADIKSGVLESELERTLTDLFLKLNRYGDGACAVNLGGVAPDGKDMFNDLTRMIIRIAARLQMPSPILAARIHPGIRKDDFDLLTTPELFRIGQPSFYGEFACRKALLRRGVAENVVERWAVNSCMGLIMPGEEFSDMWAVVFTFLLPLELALNNGRPFNGVMNLKLRTVPPLEYRDADEIFATVMSYTRELLELLVGEHQRVNEWEGRENPDPYLSALLSGGKTGCDRLLGGSKYHTANIDAFALVNVADALTAIDHVVFKHRHYSLAEVIDAVKDNFDGQEALRLELLAAPKYGNGNVMGDRTVAKISDAFAAIVREISTPEITYMPSFHTLNAHVGCGLGWGASADGRRAGEPFAKNVGPMQGRNRSGLTALLQSASAVGQEFFYGGQALDLHVEAALIGNPTDRAKFQAALQTYFEQGGLLVQVNGLDVDTLRQAVDDPEAFGDLSVRVGGYSARFVTLPREIQLEMIERFKHNT